MAEFGENLKKVREERGITQQTLANHLFVTRQAVSRWEGGSRYPDLLMAKKMAQFLEVSLDELLSDDDMKLYVDNNAILDSLVAKKVQTVLVSFVFMCSLVLSIVYGGNYFIRDSLVLESASEMTKSILRTVVLGYCVYAALFDKLNTKVAMIISTLYLGTGILTGIVGIVGQEIEIGFTSASLLGATALNVVFLIICISFFGSKNNITPIPLYIIAGVYGVIGVVSFFSGFMADIPIEIFRDVFMLRTFALMENLLLLVLLTVVAYTLNRKRKLAVK